MTYGLTYGWIPLDRSRGLVSGLHLPDALFHNWAGYNSSPRVPACSSAPLPEHLSGIWLSCSVFTCLSIIAGKVTLPNASCLTGFPLHSAFTDLSLHRTISDLPPRVCCKKRRTQAAAPSSYTQLLEKWRQWPSKMSLKPIRSKEKCIIF